MVLQQNIVFGFFSIVFLKMVSVSSVQYGSLSFVIDNTDSMTTEIQKVKEATTLIYDAIMQNSSQIQEVVLVTFNDPAFRTRLLLKDQTKSASELRITLGNIWAHGGGDCAEFSMSGIKMALLNSLHNSYLFVFTDASPKDYIDKDYVINLAQARASQVFFFLTEFAPCVPYDPEYLFKPYYDIAKATNGQVFKLVSKEQVAKIMGFLTLIVSGEGDVIKLPEIKPNQYEKIPFTVDDQTEYIVISASGTDIKLAITAGPTLNYERIAWEKDVKILKINNPLPGSYEATVKGSSTTTVMIFGRTDFTFQHGFSENIPNTFRDDVKQPTDGALHHLLVKVADPSSSVKIKSAEILNMDEKVILQLPLERVSGDYYRTVLFMPPSYPTTFKIRVIGEGKKTGKTISRTAKTPIVARLRSLDPEIEITGGGTYKFNTKVTLKCKVKANPKPTVSWKNETGSIISETTMVTLNPYEYASDLTIDAKKDTTYSCYAINKLGEKTKWVEIKVESPFIIEDKETETIYANYGKPAYLSCNIKSNYPMQIYWNHAKDGKWVTIQNSNEWSVLNEGRQLRINKVDTEAQYRCVAYVPSVTHTLERAVKINHIAPIMGNPEEIDVKENESVTIKCKILQAFPKPTIQWSFKMHGTEVFQIISTTTAAQETYTVNNADLSHDGVYRCTAENDKGKDHHDTKLVVKYKPKLNILKDGKEVNKIEVDYAADLSFACHVTGQPAPRIVWRDSKHKEIATDSAVVNGNEYIRYLKVSQVKYPETYTCFANNILGEESKSVAVEVKSPFELVPKSGYVKAKYGKETELKCGVHAKVPAKVAWSFKGKRIINSEKYLLSADSKSLKIKAVDIDLQGEYTCVTSIIGDEALQMNHKIQVIIEDIERPVLEKETTLVKVLRNGNVVLRCNIIKGNPKPTITWQVKSRKYNQLVSLNITSDNLQINAATDDDAGIYKCLAKNVIGNDEHTIELIVQGPPIILSNEDIVYRAVEGDPTLRIPCEVVGHPKPVISWSKEKDKIVAGKKFEIIENALIINNPKEEDSNEHYICNAVNEFGSAQKEFDGLVTTDLRDEDLSDPIYIDIEKGQTEKRECSNGSLQGRWFKEWIPNNITGTLILSKVKYEDTGNYTCRISDRFGSTSQTYVVVVGHRPTFDVPNYVEEWTGKKSSLYCQPEMTPSERTAKVEWFYNGKLSDKMEGSPADSNHTIIGWGTYMCKVSNIHGTATKTFQVIAKGCLLHLAPEVRNSPLVLHPATGKWPQVILEGNYWNVKSDQSLRLSCHHKMNSNTFQKLPGEYDILATCDHEDIFTVKGNKFRFSELQCQSEVLPSIEHTGKKCASDNSEKISVGYHIDQSTEFVEVYSVCYDLDKHVPVYSQVVLSSPENVVPVVESWHKYHFGEKISKSCDGESECCLGSTQLINQLEVKHGAPQTATFIEGLNSVPFWHHCHNSTTTWNKFEEYLMLQKKGFIVSGAHSWRETNNVSVPRYLWKMYQLSPPIKKPIIVVRVNARDPTDADVLCNTPCNKKVADIIKDKFTYCCNPTEFKSVFSLDLLKFVIE